MSLIAPVSYTENFPFALEEIDYRCFHSSRCFPSLPLAAAQQLFWQDYEYCFHWSGSIAKTASVPVGFHKAKRYVYSFSASASAIYNRVAPSDRATRRPNLVSANAIARGAVAITAYAEDGSQLGLPAYTDLCFSVRTDWAGHANSGYKLYRDPFGNIVCPFYVTAGPIDDFRLFFTQDGSRPSSSWLNFGATTANVLGQDIPMRIVDPAEDSHFWSGEILYSDLQLSLGRTWSEL